MFVSFNFCISLFNNKWVKINYNEKINQNTKSLELIWNPYNNKSALYMAI